MFTEQIPNKATNVTPTTVDVVCPTETKYIIAGVAGNLVCRLTGMDSDITIPVIAGVVYPMRCSHVRVVGTTAGGVIAFSV